MCNSIIISITLKIDYKSVDYRESDQESFVVFAKLHVTQTMIQYAQDKLWLLSYKTKLFCKSCLSASREVRCFQKVSRAGLSRCTDRYSILVTKFAGWAS